MEYGGNAKVNAIFEARLAQSGRHKLTNRDNGPSRERYIRDKYERRKFYDPAAFSGDFSVAAAAVAPTSSDGGGGLGQPRPGAPSEVARQRVASRQARMKPAQSTVDSSSAAAAPARSKVAQPPASAPVFFDLLDFDSAPAPAASTTPAVPAAPSSMGSPFGTDPFASPAPAAPAPAAPPKINAPPAAAATTAPATSTPTLAQEFMSTPSQTNKATSNDSIMALFGPPKQQAPQSFGMHAMNNMAPSSSNGGMMPGGMQGMMNPQMQRQQQQMMMSGGGMQGMMMNPQQQQQMMGIQGAGGGGMMPGMMTPQMQQQMMMAQQMQRQMQQNQFNQGGMMKSVGNEAAMMRNMSGSMNAGGMNAANNMHNFNSAMMGMQAGMQNMSMGGGGGLGHPGISQTPSDDGGFGAPMGGNASGQGGSNANDPFNSLGGMNAFR